MKNEDFQEIYFLVITLLPNCNINIEMRFTCEFK